MNNSQIIAMALLKYGPPLAMALVEIFSVETPTKEQWAAVFALAATPYEEYVKPIV
jgi:hypothetical protein